VAVQRNPIGRRTVFLSASAADIDRVMAIRKDHFTRPRPVRLDPELKRDLLLRAAEDNTSVSEVIRSSIGAYLPAG
jgi:hypothetical protein